MDGRNLSNSIILKWTPEISLIDIVNTIPIFIKKVLTAKVYEFYGEFLEQNNFFDIEDQNDRNEIIEIIQHFCIWLFKNECTKSKLSLASSG